MTPGNQNLDDLDAAIFSALQADGRRAFRSIAKDLGVPEETVRFRVKRMLREGIVQVTAMIHPRHLGGILVTLLVGTAPSQRRSAAVAIEQLPEVMYVSICSGRFDLNVQAVVTGLGELDALVGGAIGSVKGVNAVESLIELEVLKSHYGFAGLDPGGA